MWEKELFLLEMGFNGLADLNTPQRCFTNVAGGFSNFQDGTVYKAYAVGVRIDIGDDEALVLIQLA